MRELTGSELLLKYIADTGSSQTAFGAKAGLLPSMICHYCNGTRRPGLDAALAIDKASGGAIPATAWSASPRTKRRKAA